MLKPKYVVNINAKDDDGNNAMHFLLGHFGYDSGSSAKIATIMLKKGIEVNTLNKQEFGPIHVAIRSFQSKSIKYCLDYNAYLRHQKSQEQQPSQDNNSFKIIPIQPTSRTSFYKNLRLEPFNFNLSGKNLWTPLHYAVYNNNLIAVELLLNAQYIEHINVFARDSDSKLPQELCPFNSPIYKMIVKRQRNVIKRKIQEDNNKGEQIKFDKIDKKKYPEVVIHKYINRRRRGYQEKNKSSFIRRVNSNKMLIVGPALQLDVSSRRSPQQLQSGFMSDEDDLDQEHDDKNKIRDSIINQNNAQKRINRSLERTNAGGHNILQTSKTEKNLHSSNLIFLTNQSSRLGYNKQDLISRAAFHDPLANRSPRLQQQIPPLAPKRLLNHDEDYEENLEDFFHIEEQRFMSIPVNFDTFEENDSNEHLFTNSVSNNDSSGVDNDDYSQSNKMFCKKAASDNHSHTGQVKLSEGAELLSKDLRTSIKVFEMNQKDGQVVVDMSFQYQSAPTKDQNAIIKIQDKIGSSYKSSKKQNVATDDDEDEEDFCDAADEDAEAGALGLIANKINKFDNHNLEQEYRSINERDALKKIIDEIQQIKQKSKQNQQLQQMRYTKQMISPNLDKSPGRIKMHKDSLENPFDAKIIDSPDLHFTKEDDEGNVFDTVEHFPEWQEQEDDSSLMLIEEDKFAQRNIKQRNNIFVTGNEGGSNSTRSIIINDPSSRKSVQPMKGQRRDEPFQGQNNGVFGRLKSLNKDCKLDDQNKISIDDCVATLNNIDNSLSIKYQALYHILYHSGRILEEDSIKSLYDQIDDSLGYSTQIIKADLLYLVSLTKNKDFIPELDSAIHKFKEQSALRKQAKSPEAKPVNTSMTLVASSSSKDFNNMKTPSAQNGMMSHRQRENQSNCKNLVIYETQNAYDILMHDAMIQSKQMMEECNQKINFERQRSRERMQLKKNRSQLGLYQMHSSASGDLNLSHHHQNRYQQQKGGITNNSIRDIPEFVAHLNKSPSTQSIQNLKYNQHNSMSNFPNIGGENISGFVSKMNNGVQGLSVEDSSQNISGSYFQKKVSFTPKGSSGQVFLAFQRQKQKSRDGMWKIDGIPYSPNKHQQSDIQQPASAHFQVDMSEEENYNETILNPHRPQNMEPLTHHNRLYDNKINASSLNNSALSYYQQPGNSTNISSKQNQQSLSNIISHTIKDLQRYNQLKQSPQFLDSASFDPNKQRQQQQSQNTSQSSQLLTKTIISSQTQQKLFTFNPKQRELSHQIKAQVQSSGAAIQKKTPTTHNAVISSNVSSNKQYPNTNINNTNESNIITNGSNNNFSIPLKNVGGTQQQLYQLKQHQPQKPTLTNRRNNTNNYSNKILQSKASPNKVRGAGEMSVERVEERFRKGTANIMTNSNHSSSSQLQYAKYNKKQQQQQTTNNTVDNNNHSDRQLNNSNSSQMVTSAKYGVKHVKYNLSIDGQNGALQVNQQQSSHHKNIKKSTSTKKLVSESSFQSSLQQQI